ncbi:spore coat protein U domain-containing protein, partial [Acinetobacter baumannii]
STITACVYIGNGSGGISGGLRQLGSGANSLRYQLYADAARSVPWGSDTEFASPGPRRFLLSLPLLTLSDSVSTTLYGSVSGGQAT